MDIRPTDVEDLVSRVSDGAKIALPPQYSNCSLVMPRRTPNGAPFSAACNCVRMAGQVPSKTFNVPALTAAVKRGAKPYSPIVTAAVSTTETHPAPINKSACRPIGRIGKSAKTLSPKTIRLCIYRR